LLAVCGCGGSETARVTGTLLHKDGTPVAGARVVARSAETGKSVYGTAGADGKFELSGGEESDGIPSGNYDVIILEDRGDPDTRRPATVAAKYRDPATSGLKVSVPPGESIEVSLVLDAR
jgi:hypothetical protein